MISCISNYDRAICVKQNNYKKPSFGSLLLARVVERSINNNGDFVYTTVNTVEHGIFNSLARNINALAEKKGKQKEIFDNIARKMAAAIKDFNIKNPFIRTTNIRIKSHDKKFILTGAQARMVEDGGKDFVAARGDRKGYRDFISENLYKDMNNRVYTREGNELGLDIIVDKKTKKIVDVDITSLSGLYKPKKSVNNNWNTVPVPQPKEVFKNIKENIQSTFAFFDTLGQNVVRYGMRP